MAELTVAQHYGGEGYAERLLEVAAANGITPTPQTLAPADQFHTGGVDATRELATLAQMEPGTRVLDVGSGLGGPARILASEFGCIVTGLDITPEFVRSARVLTEACGLSDRASFEEGDATAMPFGDAQFDVVWTQHAQMNIRDREGFYREAFRVLRPGGRFIFYDILRGDGPEPEYPLPWASEPSISSLRTAEETRDLMKAAGFEEQVWKDMNQEAREFMQRMASGPPQGPLHLGLVLGGGLAQELGNLARASMQNSVAWARAVFVKPA